MTAICDNKSKMGEILDNFTMEQPKKRNWGNFKIIQNKVVYRMKKEKVWNPHTQNYESNPETTENVVAMRLSDGSFLGNASILPLVGQRSAWGNTTPNYRQTVVQSLMETDDRFQMVPFNVFQQADLDIDKFQIVARNESETVVRDVPNPKFDRYEAQTADANGKEYEHPKTIEETAHFIGSQIFRIEDSYFLFDVDRNELKHKIFNPFLVQIPTAVSTVEEAYDSLMPEVVKMAIQNGKDVKRQGEWFFIPTEQNPEADLPQYSERELELAKLLKGRWDHEESGAMKTAKLLGFDEVELDRLSSIVPPEGAKSGELRAGKNRPNRVESFIEREGEKFVMGKISHTGREHKDIILDSWHVVYPNTAIGSFTLSGDID